MAALNFSIASACLPAELSVTPSSNTFLISAFFVCASFVAAALAIPRMRSAWAVWFTLTFTVTGADPSLSFSAVILYDGGWRQGVDEPAPVAFGLQPGIQNGEHATIFSVADEAAQPLLKRQNRQGDLIVAERVTALCPNRVNTGRGNRIGRRSERQ